MYIDDVKQETVVSAYTFSTTGEHTVKCIMNDDFNNCYSMFSSCDRLTSLDLSNFSTSNALTMTEIFYGCSNLTSLYLSNFSTSNVTDMRYMFYDCKSLTSVTFGNNFDTSNVTNMKSMFYGCTNLTSLDLSNFNTSNVTSMYSMFQTCSGLTSVTFGSQADVSKVTDYSYMFRYITTTGTLYYPSAYADAWNNIIVTNQSKSNFPSTWNAQPIQ